MDYSNNWLWRMHPLLSALATNPAFYYYYTAKADLLNQSIMVRRGSSRKKPSQAAHSSSAAAAAAAGPVQGTVAVPAAPAIPAIPYPSVAPPSIVNPVAPAGPQGHKTCPQCHAAFNSTNCRRVQEACGHWKCRTCMIANEDGCPQCREVEPPSRGGGGLVSVGRRGVGQGRNTVEDLDLMPPVLMEEEPLAASSSSSSSEKGLRSMGQLLHESPPVLNKVGMKRKTKEASPSGPSKILKTAMMGSPTKGQRKSDPRERPKIMTRRSSSSSSVQSSSPTSSYAEGRGKVKGTRNSPTSSAKEKGSGLLSSQGKLSFGKDDNNGPSFAVTISPTTIPPKASLRTKPVLSPAKSSSKGGGGGSSSVDDLSHFSITSVSSSGREVVVTPHGSNSNDGSSSNSTTETCDPLYISNEWNANDSNSNSTEPTQGESSEGVKKKKKRSPVTIHDHITILSGDPLLYQCNVCMKKFKTKAHIKYHEFCQNGEKPYKCEQCGQGFIAKSHYEYHLRTHTGERPYVCPKCGKGFNQRGKVTRHMRSHTGEKPFICQQCGRGFANAQALRSHFLIHTGERPFACQYCNKRFTGMTNLKKHVITHTGERPFTCNHCGKSFGLKWTLDLHLRTHSTERPFQCDQCTRAFSNSKDLRRHLVIHSGERPFKCWICGTAFRRKDNLDRHIKNTHNQPKEVAKQLANEAAAEYMAQTKATQAALAAAQATTTTTTTTGVEETPSTSKKTTTTTTSSSLPSEPMVPNILARSVKKKDVIITADLSPPNSPSPAPAALGETNAVRDVYVLPNGQGQLQPAAVIHTVSADGKPTVEAHFVAVQNFEGLAELRTVPVNEYHQLEGVGLLEKAKSASPAEKEGEVIEEEHEVVEKDVKPRVVGEGDILFCGAPTGTTADGGRNLTQGLTVTVVYENDGKTHFITDQPSQYNPATVDPLSFSTDQSTGLMAIPRETLFSFASSSTTSTTPSSASAPLNSGGQENTQEDSCSSSTPSESRTSEIHLKKSETILSGNLSKYLQMDLPKNVNYSEDQDGVIPSEDDFQDEQQQKVVQEDGELLNSSESRNNNEQENENSVSAQAFSSYAVKSEIDIEYVTRAVGTPDNTGEDDGADPASPLSAVSEADLEERNVASTAATGKKDEQQPDKNLEPFKVSGAKENELEEGEIERESVGKGSTANKKENGGNEGRTNKPAPKEAAVDSTGPAAGTDAYPSDPMLQDPNADEEEERLDVEESTPQEIPPDSVTKSGEDSMLPDGMEDTYGSPGAIFADNMVGRKDDDSQCFRGIVDKECPSSILQDEPSDNNCDPISDEDDQDFANSSSFQGPESPLEAGEIPRRRAALRESIDMECPQLILQPEGSAAAGNELPEDPQLPEGLLFSASLSRPPHDNDTESISSTELEPDEPNKAPETPEEEETSQAPGFKYDGTVDDVCPPSILQEDEDEGEDRDVPEALPAQNPPEERPTESKGMTEEAKGRTGDSRGTPTAAKGTPTESKGTATSNLKLVPRHMENLETEQLIGDNMKGSLENEKLVVTHRNSSEDWSETEPISDTEFDPEVEDRAAASSFSFSSSSSPSTNLKRKRPEEEEERQAEKIIKNEILTAPKNALSPTAASSIIAAAEEEANNKLHDNEYIETSTNLNGSPERTEGGDVVKETGVSGDSLTFSVGELKECGKSPYDSDDGDDDVRILEESKGSPEGSQMHLELEENSVDENSMEGRILVSNVRSLGPETCLGNSVGTLACTSAGTSMVGSSVATSSSESVIIKTEETDPEIQTVAIIERSKTTTTETVAYEMIRETPGAMMTTQRIEVISPEPPPTAQVAYVAIPEVPPRLIYTTNPLVTSTPTTILVAQPVNLTSGSSTSSSYAPPLQSQPISSRNYRIVYAPAEVASTSTAATSSYPESSQPSFRFVYENGEPMLENVEPVVDNNMRIVYACAAATADPPGNCGAQKLKLLYAEALGVGTPDESGQVQLVYTSTAPNQNLVHAPNQNVRIYSPAFLTADTDTKNIEMLIQQQQQHQQQPQVEGPGPVPVQVLYNGNGMVMAQTVGQPQDLSWIRRDLNHSFTTAASTSTTRHAPAQSEKLIPAPTTTTTAVYPSNNTRMQNINNNLASTREIIANHHNYASSPYIHVDGSKRVRFPAPFEAPAHQQAAGEPDGLRTLARAAATRMITIQADADATTRAAAAIAAVGREAQIKRQMDMLERNRNLPGGSPTTTTVFIRKGENVPHRGPRKHYLSQLTNSSRK